MDFKVETNFGSGVMLVVKKNDAGDDLRISVLQGAKEKWYLETGGGLSFSNQYLEMLSEAAKVATQQAMKSGQATPIEELQQVMHVESKMCVSLGYFSFNKRLRIIYPRGATYEYADVEEIVWRSLMATVLRDESIGSAITEQIKNAGYQYIRVG